VLRDLERVSFQNVLDVELFKRTHGRLDDATLDGVNDELARVTAVMNGTRREIQTAREIETLVEGRYSPEITDLVLGEIVRSRIVDEAHRGFDTPAPAIEHWIRDLVPGAQARARADRARELNVRSSSFYRVLRPLVANVWEATDSGFVGLNGWVWTPRSLRPPVEHGKVFAEKGISTWLAAALLAILIGAALWIGRKKIFSISWWWPGGLFVVAPVCVVLLLFPVRTAFNANTATKNVADSIAAQVVAHRVQGEYTARGAGLYAQLEPVGREAASAILNQARARGEFLKSQAEQKATTLKNGILLTGTSELAMPNMARAISKWMREQEGRLLNAPFSIEARRRTATFAREFEYNYAAGRVFPSIIPRPTTALEHLK
jgi:hypothetical protein